MTEPSLFDNSQGRVLIVDDEPDTRDIIGRLLRFEGFDVLTASSGEEGVKRVENQLFVTENYRFGS